MIQSLYGIAGKLYRAVKPIRDAQYRAFIRTFPCCACGKSWWIEAAHTGPHGVGQKACDLRTIPLCRTCHPLFDQSPAKFATAHHLDIEALVQMFQSFHDTLHPERREPEVAVQPEQPRGENAA